jgi:hypothetical protein
MRVVTNPDVRRDRWIQDENEVACGHHAWRSPHLHNHPAEFARLMADSDEHMGVAMKAVGLAR